jgi:hypothetical protein
MSNASRFVRPSKFRHVYAEPSKPEVRAGGARKSGIELVGAAPPHRR